MTLFDRLFYSGPMLAVFSDENRLQRMLDFESALAYAEAEAGLISVGSAVAIAQQCRAEILDVDALRDDAARAGNLAIPLIKQLTACVSRSSPDAARSVHWGATSQDVIDTGLVLQMREALRLLDGQLRLLCESLAEMVEKHAETTMAGRTWLQQAVPISFGWKAAGWLDTMLRHRERLSEIVDRSLVLQFGGAAGTLAALGDAGPVVSRGLAAKLSLKEPQISWHTSRDRMAEIACAVGMLVGSMGKIARDLSLLMQTEVGEVSEAAEKGRGGSSTMPHKRNPVGCASILTAANRVPGLVATVLAAMGQENERGLGNWQAEWETVPEIFNLCGGALEKLTELIGGLQVDSERMATNLELTRGLVYAEAVAMALTMSLGKPGAHAMVERLCQEAVQSKRHLRDVLERENEGGLLLIPEEVARLFDPTQYLGSSRSSIDQVLRSALESGVATQSGWIDHAGAKLYFKYSGSPELPVLVLSHSLGSDMTMWDAQLASFAKEFRILRIDTRGHGQSSVTPGPYSIEILGCDVIAVVDALGIQSFLFCGLSMGGVIGQWLALNRPERLSKVVLCNTAAKIGTQESWDTRVATVQREGLGPLVPGVLERWFTEPFRRSHPGLMAKIGAVIAATATEGYTACCMAIRDADFREQLSQIRRKTLVIAGSHDPATTVAEGRQMAEKIEGSVFVELNAAHLSNVEMDRAFSHALLEFLKS